MLGVGWWRKTVSGLKGTESLGVNVGSWGELHAGGELMWPLQGSGDRNDRQVSST